MWSVPVIWLCVAVRILLLLLLPRHARSHASITPTTAKELVESAPDAIIKKDCPKEEAEELLEKLKKVGGEAVME